MFSFYKLFWVKSLAAGAAIEGGPVRAVCRGRGRLALQAGTANGPACAVCRGRGQTGAEHEAVGIDGELVRQCIPVSVAILFHHGGKGQGLGVGLEHNDHVGIGGFEIGYRWMDILPCIDGYFTPYRWIFYPV